MNEHTEQELSRFLANMNDAMEGGGQFTLEQAPLVAQEIVLWERVENTTGVVIGGIGFVVTLLLTLKFGKSVAARIEATPSDEGAGTMGRTVAGAACLVASMFLLFEFCESLFQCIHAWCAPRLVILEHIGNLL